jgi:flagellar basal-body rod protein FlgG
MFNEIMQVASYNSIKQTENLEQIATNVANINTTGFKTHRFEQYLRNDGVLDGTVRVDYSQGPMMITRRELDIAIKGDGFIPVTQPDGTVAYTRDGSFAKNSDGYLVTNRGDLVGNGIQLPVYYDKVLIQEDGTVQVRLPKELEPKTVGKIDLVTFKNPEGLKSIEGNKLVPTATSGKAEKLPENTTQIKQGCLERGNVNQFHQIDQILRLNASVISNLRIVKFTDDLYRQSVNLKQ